MDSPYDDLQAVALATTRGEHRNVVGGMWEQIGSLQIEFMKRQGLAPEHALLDVGCGSLRGGVKYVAYLNPGNYWGMDINPSLLDAGYDVELAAAGLQDRLPREHLIANGDFILGEIGRKFDFAVALSLFTHVSLNRIRECLERLQSVMKPGGTLFATYFELPDGTPSFMPVTHAPAGIVTHGTRDPYHYRVSDLTHAAAGLPWTVRVIGDWSHPRGQRMIAFVRQPG